MACVAALKTGNAPWRDCHNILVVTAWWTVSSSPLGSGAQQTQQVFWLNIRNEYNRLCIVAGVKLGTPTKKDVVYRPRTWRALQKQFGKLQLSINHFIGDYVRSSYVVRASGAGEEDFMADAHKFYVAKHLEVFTHVDEFLFLRSFPKYMYDYGQALKNGGDVSGGPKKAPGGPGSRKVVKTRQYDTDEELTGERPARQKRARKLQREEEEREVLKLRNLASIAFEQEIYTERAALHRESILSDNGRAAADMKLAEVNREIEDHRVMGMDLELLDEESRMYFRGVKAEIRRRTDERAAQQEVDMENARVAAEVVAEERRRAEEYAASPEGIAASRAAEEAADEADAARAAAMVAATLAASAATVAKVATAAAVVVAAAKREAVRAAKRAAVAEGEAGDGEGSDEEGVEGEAQVEESEAVSLGRLILLFAEDMPPAVETVPEFVYDENPADFPAETAPVNLEQTTEDLEIVLATPVPKNTVRRKGRIPVVSTPSA